MRMVPGTQRLQMIQNLVIWLSRIMMPWAGIVLLVAVGWPWAVLTLVVWFVIVNPIQTQLNYELAARLVSLDQRLDADEAR